MLVRQKAIETDMKITVRELKSVIGRAVAEAKGAKSKKKPIADKKKKRTVREGAEHAEIADAFEQLIDMHGWDEIPNGEQMLASLRKMNARLQVSSTQE